MNDDMWDEILQGDVEFLEGGLVASTRPLGANADFYKDCSVQTPPPIYPDVPNGIN